MKNTCCLFFAAALTACGAELVINSVSVPRGSQATTLIHFSAGESRVAALQFDVERNPAFALAGSAGQVAVAAGKVLYSANIESGHTRFLLVGLNGSILNDGVLIEVSVAVNSSTGPGSYPLQIRNAIASDPEGYEVPLTGTDGSVAVGGAITNLAPSGLFAHVASGEGWKSTFTLMNPAATESTARLVFWDDGGNPLLLPFSFPSNPRLLPSTGSAVDVTIPSNGVVVVEAGAPNQFPIRAGWAELQASGVVLGWATFGQQFNTGYAIEALVPMETRKASSMVLPFDSSNGFSTGVALANASDAAPANIQMLFRGVDGQQLFTDIVSMPARGHRSFSLSERYPGLAGQAGSLELQNPTGGAISVLGLRFSQRGSVTSIPAAVK